MTICKPNAAEQAGQLTIHTFANDSSDRLDHRVSFLCGVAKLSSFLQRDSDSDESDSTGSNGVLIFARFRLSRSPDRQSSAEGKAGRNLDFEICIVKIARRNLRGLGKRRTERDVNRGISLASLKVDPESPFDDFPLGGMRTCQPLSHVRCRGLKE